MKYNIIMYYMGQSVFKYRKALSNHVYHVFNDPLWNIIWCGLQQILSIVWCPLFLKKRIGNSQWFFNDFVGFKATQDTMIQKDTIPEIKKLK